MTKRFRDSGAWLLAGLMTAVLWVFLYFYADIHYATNDDQFILRTFMGCQPGGAPTFHLYIHGMYAYPLRWLSLLFPGVAWFSIIQIALLSLSLTVIAKSVIQCFCRAGRGLWVGAFFAALYLTVFGMSYCARITYTSTAAQLGAAAVAQMLSVDCKSRSNASILRSMGFALLLVVLCYGLRQMTALPVLAYCGIAFALKYMTCFGFPSHSLRPGKPMIVTLLMVAVVMGGLAVGREIEIDAKGQRDYLDWQQARISVLDYIDLEKLPPEALEAVGWTNTQVELLLKWNTMDEAVSTEAFRTIRETQYNADTRTSPGAAIQDLLLRSPYVAYSIALWAMMLILLFVLLLRRGKDGFWHRMALICVFAFCLSFFTYLALLGRLPYRAVVVPILPAAVFVFCLLPEGLPPRSGKPALTAVLCGLCLLMSLCYAVPAARYVKKQPLEWDYSAFADLDRQAVIHSDRLYIYSTELVNDMRMFPDFSGGIPTNLMFWGGWQRGSPEYIARLAPFGLNSDHFTAEDWLREGPTFVTLTLEPDETLFQYLRESISPDIVLDGQQVSDALFTFWFHPPESAE